MFGKARKRRIRDREERIGGGHMNRLIPNAITVGALCAGLSGVRFAIDSRWEMAVAAIVVAAILDGLDGRMARLLNGTSKFGAELDSLSDFVSFGAAPALIVYLWTLNTWGGFGWVIALSFAVCCALRLRASTRRWPIQIRRAGPATSSPASLRRRARRWPCFR